MFSDLSQNRSKAKIYRQLQKIASKWNTIAFNPVNNQRKAKKVIESIYQLLDREKPEIKFFPSPQAVFEYLQQNQSKVNLNLDVNSRSFKSWKKILNQQLAASKMAKLNKSEQEEVIDYLLSAIEYPPWNIEIDSRQDLNLSQNLVREIEKKLINPLIDDFIDRIDDNFIDKIDDNYNKRMGEIEWSPIKEFIFPAIDLTFIDRRCIEIEQSLKTALVDGISDETWQIFLSTSTLPRLHEQRVNFIYPEWLVWDNNGLSAFDMDVYRFLGIKVDDQLWKLWQNLLAYCGWLIPLEKYCLVCQRPTYSWNSEGICHADGQPAMNFVDGTGFYYFNGVRLPEKYHIPSDKWQTDWLLTEPNAEVRRALIEGLGYDRICQQLDAQVIDYWMGYELLKIENIDFEDILLLKMICPSTKHIHALRVPPHMRSAREAIRWVNWDIDPEKFTIQT